ncbi:GMC family oxidoreductase N-terminal domain-containing protein [Mycolicibacterium goodii]|nr:GMC family oxidoreductase N-terminal domain-containing protein [Mycolicibacterium goodii]MBU8813132.1 GMC family oxidoreductase N-terminal domain-containing protein [Mycolicibacterium goodii]
MNTTDTTELAERVQDLRKRLESGDKVEFDFIVCGAGTSGSVVARRLAEDSDATVLLLEAGGDDDVESVMDPQLWPTNLGTERDWGFVAEQNTHLNNRALPMSMGKVLGGGSSINVMCWARGHKADWDFFAAEAGDPAWSYDSVLKIYRVVEDWAGTPDPLRRGAEGPVHVEPVPRPQPCATATVEAARTLGLPTFDSPNGVMMEGAGGAAMLETVTKDGRRQSIYRSYVVPVLGRTDLTVLTGAVVRRVITVGQRATGVEINLGGSVYRITARSEVILSLGAINTPKVLMQSGIGDEKQLWYFGIPVVAHLPGVGRNLQDHLAFPVEWEFPEGWGCDARGQSCMYWCSDSGLTAPDLYACYAGIPFGTPETAARFPLPASAWFLYGTVAQPQSRGTVTLTGARPEDPVEVHANSLAHPEDLEKSRRCVEFLREIGNAPELRPYVRRPVMPGNLTGEELNDFLRNAGGSFWHQVGTAKMGRGPMSVVDAQLKVHGVDGLRVADGSVMPRLTTGNTMAPCVVIGELASQALLRRYRGSGAH